MMYSIVLFFKFTLFSSVVLSENTYECGEHGRFEYCIDEIPGCVIGCHCHPGYYFDTDSKICEPNAKLIEHHRRHYTGEPTRILNAATPNVISETEPDVKSKFDNHVDEISNDANDLGDWLYNQFFKTIENQVINNTSEKDIPTRRSGTSVKRLNRTKKKWSRDRRRNKKSKRKQLKNKLLRITENDSLFDLSSKSNSDSSDSSSSSVSSAEHTHNGDGEHGHKKIVVYNKKPKPPLPSFIFLPNMNTPYYPPIGLPPPPVVPMYPIVPVPPVIPFGIGADCTTKAAETTSSPTTIATSSATSVTDGTSITQQPTTQAVPADLNIRQSGKKRKKKMPRVPKQFNDYENDDGLSKLQPGNRQKLLSRLKERMNNPSAKYFISPWKRNKKILMNTRPKDDVFESPLIEHDIPENILRNPSQEKITQNEGPPANVDFKYLTELIHRVDLENKTNDLPPIEYNPLESVEMYTPPVAQKHDYSDFIVPPNTPDSRRYVRPSNSNNKLDDLYYTKLGREIASMIRGIDVQNRDANIQMQQTHDSPKGELYFNNNSPRSYWERSVRSPLTYLNMNKSKFEYLKRSNELLFDIENKIQIIASTVPTLSLQEIENMVRVMDVAKKGIKDRETGVKTFLPNSHNFNINLWPPHENIINHKAPSQTDQHFGTNNGKRIDKPSRKPSGPHIQVQQIQRLMAWQKPHKVENSNAQQTNKQFQSNANFNPYFPNTLHTAKPLYENKSKIAALPQNNLKESLLGYDMNSVIMKHKKYFNNDNNFNIDTPPPYARPAHPSYFHQEINHFDYIN